MTLPTSRNETYSNGTPVEAATMNDLQDAVIDGKSGERVLHLAAASAQVVSGAPVLTVPKWTIGNAESIALPVPFNKGDRIVSVKAFLHENAGAAMFCDLRRYNGTTGTDTSIDSGSSAGGGTYAQINLTGGGLPYTTIANESLVMKVLGAAAGQEFSHVEVTYDHP